MKKDNTDKVLRMPAYNTHGTEYVRILPPVRNRRVINVSILCDLLIRHMPQNAVSCLPDGIILNEVTVRLSEGLASTKTLKFRFSDLFELLFMLKQEHLLTCKIEDLYRIKREYFKELHDNV